MDVISRSIPSIMIEHICAQHFARSLLHAASERVQFHRLFEPAISADPITTHKFIGFDETWEY